MRLIASEINFGLRVSRVYNTLCRVFNTLRRVYDALIRVYDDPHAHGMCRKTMLYLYRNTDVLLG